MIDDALIELLRPLVVEVVREELARETRETRWLRVPAAAVKLGLSEKAIYQRVARGQLHAQRVGRTLWIDTQLDPSA